MRDTGDEIWHIALPRIRRSVGQEDEIAPGHERVRQPGSIVNRTLHLDRRLGQSVSAQRVERIYRQADMGNARILRHGRRTFELNSVALAIVERDRRHGITPELADSPVEAGRRILAARQQYQRFLVLPAHSRSPVGFSMSAFSNSL